MSLALFNSLPGKQTIKYNKSLARAGCFLPTTHISGRWILNTKTKTTKVFSPNQDQSRLSGKRDLIHADILVFCVLVLKSSF